MSNNKPSHSVSVAIESGSGRDTSTYWLRVGSLWEKDHGSIVGELQALPLQAFTRGKLTIAINPIRDNDNNDNGRDNRSRGSNR